MYKSDYLDEVMTVSTAYTEQDNGKTIPSVLERHVYERTWDIGTSL